MTIAEDLAAVVLSAHVLLTEDGDPRSRTDLDAGDCSCGLGARQFIDHSHHQAQELSKYLQLVLANDRGEVAQQVISSHREGGNRINGQLHCSCGAAIGYLSDPRDGLALHRLDVLNTSEKS